MTDKEFEEKRKELRKESGIMLIARDDIDKQISEYADWLETALIKCREELATNKESLSVINKCS